MGRALLLIGGMLVVCGLLLMVAPKMPWIGRLPGDLAIERPGFRFYFPLTCCVLASFVMSVVLWLISRFRS